MTRVKCAISAFLALFCVIAFVSCSDEVGGGSDDDRTVLSVGGHKIDADEYSYFWLNYRKARPDAAAGEVKQLVEDALRADCALYVLAEENGYELGESEKSEIESSVQGAIASYGGEEAYYAALEQANMTGDVYRTVIERQVLELALRTYMTDEYTGCITSDDATLEKDIEQNFYCAKQIYLSNDEGENPEDNRTLAAALLERIKAGEDFDALLAEYGEDADMDAENGYYFTAGQMIEEFEAAARSLEPGDVSEVVESSGGFHIIRRLTLDPEYIDANFEKLRYYFQSRRFNEERADAAQKLELDYSISYDELGLG